MLLLLLFLLLLSASQLMLSRVPPFLHPPLLKFASIWGVPPDQPVVLLILFFSFIFASFYRSIPVGFLRHLYSIALGAIIVWILVGEEVVYLLIHAVVAYIIMLTVSRCICPSFAILLLFTLLLFLRFRKYLPVIAFFWCLGFLSAWHIFCMIRAPYSWRIDVTAMLMMTCVKMHTMACDYSDGLRLKAGEVLYSFHLCLNTFRFSVSLWFCLFI